MHETTVFMLIKCKHKKIHVLGLFIIEVSLPENHAKVRIIITRVSIIGKNFDILYAILWAEYNDCKTSAPSLMYC